MRTSLSALLASNRVLLADGATGTNYFAAGLTSGEPPEFWTTDRPDEVTNLHQQFVDAGADIILTNTFGCNPQRLKLHNAQHRTYELAKRATELARKVADAADRPIVVAGSVGPTGELFEPMGALTHDIAVASFTTQMRGLLDGGADVAWMETMSSSEEVNAAVEAATAVGLPYVATYSFDTAGRTMMGPPASVSGRHLCITAGSAAGYRRQLRRRRVRHPRYSAAHAGCTVRDRHQGKLRCASLRGHRGRVLRHS